MPFCKTEYQPRVLFLIIDHWEAKLRWWKRRENQTYREHDIYIYIYIYILLFSRSIHASIACYMRSWGHQQKSKCLFLFLYYYWSLTPCHMYVYGQAMCGECRHIYSLLAKQSTNYVLCGVVVKKKKKVSIFSVSVLLLITKTM
jgi:hypothetical protein